MVHLNHDLMCGERPKCKKKSWQNYPWDACIKAKIKPFHCNQDSDLNLLYLVHKVVYAAAAPLSDIYSKWEYIMNICSKTEKMRRKK